MEAPANDDATTKYVASIKHYNTVKASLIPKIKESLHEPELVLQNRYTCFQYTCRAIIY